VEAVREKASFTLPYLRVNGDGIISSILLSPFQSHLAGRILQAEGVV